MLKNRITLKNRIELTTQEIQEQYLADDIPWIIGYSGGKDSTAMLQLVMYALNKLPKEKLSKKVHVLTNDTLVENPAIVNYVDNQLKLINNAGKKYLFPHFPQLFQAIKVSPKLGDRFWLNLIGRGYPSPNRWFRWCTDRLKISPTNDYILQQISKHGKAIILLGTRKSESSNRKKSMDKYEIAIKNIKLRKHSLPNAWVFAPLAEWDTSEIWQYLMSVPNYWQGDNKVLVTLYRNASSDATECPLVIDTSTPSCGKSRFGCWVCTVVNKDSSMENLIESGEDWMEPMLDFRDYLAEARNDETKRMDVSRNNQDRLGPFKYEERARLLRMLLEVQKEIQRSEPKLELISKEELAAIQVQWNYDGSFNYNVSTIYENIFGKPLLMNDEGKKQEAEELRLLEQICLKQNINPDHIRTLMETEKSNARYLRRGSIFIEMRKKVERFVADIERAKKLDEEFTLTE